MASRKTPGPKSGSKPGDISSTPPPRPSNVEDLGDLNDLGFLASMTISALAEAVAGAKSAPNQADDDDALGLGSMMPSSGPPSGILRPSALPDDDALSLDMLPATPGNEASLSFVARSDIRSGDSELGDLIATGPVMPTGRTPAWFAPPKSSGRLPKLDGSPSGSKLLTGNTSPPPERSDIFSGSQSVGSSLPHAGDSNLLSVMAGRGGGESSNILSGFDDVPSGPQSDLFGDSRILTDSKPDMPRPSSDILAGSRIDAGQSDILHGSSLFDDPEKTTDRLSGSKSVASPDQFVPLFDEDSIGSSIILNKPTDHGISGSPDPIDDDPGLISFDIPKKIKKPNSSGGDAVEAPDDTDDERTSFMAIPEDEDDALAAEFLGGGVDRSGVNLLGAYDHQETMSEGDDEDSSEDVFNARTMMDIDIGAGSGLNLLTPGSEKVLRVSPGPGSKSESIFSGPGSGKIDSKSGGSELVSRSGPNSPASIFGPETGGVPSSAIFPIGKKKSTDAGGQVNFDIPGKSSPDNTDRMQASGLIDWTKGSSDSDQLSLRTQMTEQMSQPEEMRQTPADDTARTAAPFELEESDSVFDVHLPEDASTESQLFKAEQYARAAAAGAAVAESGIIAGRSGKIPKVEPVSSRTKFIPPPPPKRGSLAWLGGSAAGLLAGVGISSAAIFSGMIPGKPASQTAEIAQVRDEYESKLLRATADLNAAVETTKAETLKEAKKAELEIVSKLTTAQTTAKVANEARDVAVRNLEAARKDATAANSKVDEARGELASAIKAREEAIESLKPLQSQLTKLESAAKSAEDRLTAATKQVETTNSALVSAVKELQSANLIDPKADPSKSFALIPDAIKKAAAGGSTPDGKRLQELTTQLIAAKKEADAARTEASDAKTKADLTVAKATEKLQAELAKLKTGSNEVVQKAVAAAAAENKTRLEAIAADLRREREDRKAEATQFEAKLAAQAEEFRQQIASARAGIVVTQTDTERNAAERSARLFGVGTDAYFEARYGDAISALSDATKANPSDARAWYYLGLAQWMNGDKNGAALSYQTAARWESRSSTAARQVGPALERVQGPARTFLETFRP